MSFRTVAVIVAGLVLSACTTKHAVDAYDPPSVRLTRTASFYVMMPVDGRFGATVYPGSGRYTAQAVVGALSTNVSSVQAAVSVEDLPSAFEKAKAAGLSHVFETTILNWEDRATEWSGRPDRITLRFAVYEVATGKPVTTSLARASSKWATFGGDHPQDLLPVPTGQFVNNLF